MLSVILTILGLFEVFTVIQILNNPTFTRLLLFPSYFYEDTYTNSLLCSFLLYLGLLRLQYVYSGKTFISWLILILTHSIECVFFWNLAYASKDFNIKQLPLKEFIIDVISMNYDKLSTVILLGVPCLVIYFLFSPSTSSSNKKSKINDIKKK